MKEMYLVALIGKDVYQDFLELGLLTCISDLDKVRKFLYDEYCMEFEELSSRFTYTSWEFANITDSRDITLYVKKLPIFEWSLKSHDV